MRARQQILGLGKEALPSCIDVFDNQEEELKTD